MERTIISLNVENFLTIMLMVIVGYAFIGGLISLGRQFMPSIGSRGAAQD